MLQQIISLALWLFVPQIIALLEILHKARLDCHALEAHVLKFGPYNLKFELFLFKAKQKEGNWIFSYYRDFDYFYFFHFSAYAFSKFSYKSYLYFR